MAYTREQIIEKIEKAMENPATLYKAEDDAKSVNHRGITADGERYTEIIAKHLLDNYDRWAEKIPMITRKKTYDSTHDGTVPSDLSNAEGTSPKIKKQKEKRLAIKMFNTVDHFSLIGKICDYETPLKSVRSDVAGKIDLFSKCEDGSIILLELKTAENQEETLLRAVLEIYTYSRIVDGKKLLKDFGLAADTQIRKAVLLGHGSQAHNDYHDGEWVKELMKKLGVEIFVLNEETMEVTLP